jgi:glucokinase
MTTILAFDIGGTRSRAAIFESRGTELTLGTSVELETQRFRSFTELLQAFRESELRIGSGSAAVIAAAGPVQNGVCIPPNVPWTIELETLRSSSGIRRAAMINDFLAVCYSILTPARDSAVNMLAGTPEDEFPIAVLGAGTGLGKAALVPRAGAVPAALPSEGGHGNFPAESDEEWEYAAFLKGKHKGRYVSWEDVLSGRGLAALHEFLTGHQAAPAEVGALLTPESRTAEWFARFYGRAARNFALEVLARGGVFIAGGVAAKNPLLIRHAAFAAEFRSPRTHAGIFSAIPVRLLSNEHAGLWGAAYYGLLTLQ